MLVRILRFLNLTEARAKPRGERGQKNMGKKRIIQKSPEELLAEREKVEASIRKDLKIAPKKLKEGKVYIFSSYNNTLMTLTTLTGEVLLWKSAGAIGFKGTKKGTPFAASKVAEAFSEGLKKIGIEKVEIAVKGIGAGRDSALRSLANQNIEITSITDVTPMPHNGCRPRKARRV